MSINNSQIIKYGILVLLLASVAVGLFLYYENKAANERTREKELLEEQIRNDLAAPAPGISDKEAARIRVDLSKPPNATVSGTIKNEEGKAELTEEQKAKIRAELQK